MNYKMIVGLGNYPQKYHNTFHNIGFWFVDFLAQHFAVEFDKKKCFSQIAEFELDGTRRFLIKPETLMNNSGEAVFAMKKKHGLSNKDILIVYDDIDLPIGSYRFREKGSAGTHNGMKSVIYFLDSCDVARIRIGIMNGNRNCDLVDYVLSQVDIETKKTIMQAIVLSSKTYLNL